jgi:glycosyltransferase involved in cell wall biosynthesis
VHNACKSKILIITSIFPPDIGGPASYVPKIAEALSKKFEVKVITLSEVKDTEEKFPFEVLRLKRRESIPLRMLKTIIRIILEGRGTDIIFSNGLGLEATLANLFLKKPLVIKVVADEAWERATRRSWTNLSFMEFQREGGSLKLRFLKAMRNFYVKRADKVIVPSHFLKDVVKGWGVDGRKIKVIHNAVKEIEVEMEARTKVKSLLPAEWKELFKVLTVGRLIPLKKIDTLIKLVKEIKKMALIVVGEGPEKSNLENLVESLGIRERVFFTGMLERIEVLKLMKECDVFVLNSQHEGFPHVILEAMMVGIPVIATGVGGIPEIVDDCLTGFLVKPDDPKLREVLEKLKDEKLREEISKRAKEKVKTFSWDVVEKETFEVLIGKIQ